MPRCLSWNGFHCGPHQFKAGTSVLGLPYRIAKSSRICDGKKKAKWRSCDVSARKAIPAPSIRLQRMHALRFSEMEFVICHVLLSEQTVLWLWWIAVARGLCLIFPEQNEIADRVVPRAAIVVSQSRILLGSGEKRWWNPRTSMDTEDTHFCSGMLSEVGEWGRE